MNNKPHHTSRGFTTLLIVVVVLSLTLASALALAERGIVGAKDDRLRTKRIQAEYAAQACAEVALLALRDSGSSSGSVSQDPVFCTYTTTDVGSGNYTIVAEGVDGSTVRTVEVAASFDGTQVTVTSWQKQ